MKQMDFNRICRRMVVAVVVAAAGMVAVSCINDADPCADEPQPVAPVVPARSGDMWLSVDLRNMEVSGRNVSSRASEPDDGDKHPEENATTEENYVDTSDLNIMLLDHNRRVIRTFGSEDYEVTGAAGKYSLTLKIHTDYFAYAGKEPTDMVDFSLLFIANLNGISGADGAFGENYLFNTIQELSKSYRGFPYTGLMGNNSPWQPSLGTNNRLIPMAGVAAMSVKRSELNDASTKDKALNLPDIYIQRSMAKVRLVDALAANGDTKHKIKKVTLTGFNSRGAYLPLLTDVSPWAKETSVVEYGTALRAWWNAVTELPSAPVPYTDEQDYVGFGADMKYDAYNIYVPEFDWDVLDAGAQGPTLHIEVFDKDKHTTRTYDYKFPAERQDADGKTVDADFARNHIYQVVVTGVKEEDPTQPATIQVKYAVCPWSLHTTVIPPFN